MKQDNLEPKILTNFKMNGHEMVGRSSSGYDCKEVGGNVEVINGLEIVRAEITHTLC